MLNEIMKIVEAQGFSREKALETTGLNVDVTELKNATQMWKKEGSPISDKELAAFLDEYVKKNKYVGAYIVVENAVDDTRIRPYTYVKEVTVDKRKWKTIYQIIEADFNMKYTSYTETVEDEETGEMKEVERSTPYKKETITKTVLNPETEEMEEVQVEVELPNVKVTYEGVVVGRADRKGEAEALAKELTALNKRNYVIKQVKEVVEGQKYAGFSEYTPSKSAKMGKFVFAVRN